MYVKSRPPNCRSAAPARAGSITSPFLQVVTTRNQSTFFKDGKLDILNPIRCTGHYSRYHHFPRESSMTMKEWIFLARCKCNLFTSFPPLIVKTKDLRNQALESGIDIKKEREDIIVPLNLDVVKVDEDVKAEITDLRPVKRRRLKVEVVVPTLKQVYKQELRPIISLKFDDVKKEEEKLIPSLKVCCLNVVFVGNLPNINKSGTGRCQG